MDVVVHDQNVRQGRGTHICEDAFLKVELQVLVRKGIDQRQGGCITRLHWETSRFG